MEGMGGSESTSISAAQCTRLARAAAPKEGPEGRKEEGVEDINKNNDGGKKQKGLVSSVFKLGATVVGLQTIQYE
jgi:hypothetical protein